MKRTILFAILITALGLTACAPRAEAPAASPEMPLPMEAEAMTRDLAAGAPAMEESFAAPSALDQSNLASQAGAADRLVVRNADLSIVVKDVKARVAAIQNMANAMGGFVVSSSVYEAFARDGTPVPQAQVVIRIPQEKLSQALEQIKQGTVEVQNESQSGQDVTDRYVDLQSRLKAKLAAEEQLTEIMQEARRTEDVLAVYAQLQQIQSEIEVLRGQIKYTEQSAALSSISISIMAEETVEPIAVGGWKLGKWASDAVQDLIYFWQDFAAAMVTIVLYILPVLITIAIPLTLAFLLLRWFFRKLRGPKAAAPPATPKKK
jgi:hypothetical protein